MRTDPKPTGIRLEVKTTIGSYDQRQMRRRGRIDFDHDHRSPHRLQPEWRDPSDCRNLVAPGPGGIHDDIAQNFARRCPDAPRIAFSPDRDDPRIGEQSCTGSPGAGQKPLVQSGNINIAAVRFPDCARLPFGT